MNEENKMTDEEVWDKIDEDLTARGAKIYGLIITDEDGKLQFISYDQRGIVTFLSDKANNMSINEKTGGRMVRNLVTID